MGAARRSFYSKVVGVTAKNDDGSVRQDYIRAWCKPGMNLDLRREPANRYDKNAIAVWINARIFLWIRREVQIGYLEARVADELSRHLAQGGLIQSVVRDVTGGGRKNSGVNIELFKL